MQGITQAIDSRDGVFIGGKHLHHNFKPMPHITTFDGLIAGPDKIANQLDGSQIEQAELMEHAPKDSEYRPDNFVDVVTGKPDSNWFIEKAELMEHAPKDSEYRPDNLVDVVTGKPDSNWFIEKAELMEHAPKDSEYGGEGHGDVNNSDNPVGSSVITYIFAPSAEMYSFGECESLDSCLEPMLDQLSSDSILFQSENQLLSN